MRIRHHGLSSERRMEITSAEPCVADRPHCFGLVVSQADSHGSRQWVNFDRSSDVLN